MVLNFVATSALTKVTFTDISPNYDNLDLLLDDVRLNEPSVPTLYASLALRLSFQTDVGQVYQLEQLNSFDQRWLPVGDPTQAGASELSFYEPISEKKEFFRLVLSHSGVPTGTNDCYLSTAR